MYERPVYTSYGHVLVNVRVCSHSYCPSTYPSTVFRFIARETTPWSEYNQQEISYQITNQFFFFFFFFKYIQYLKKDRYRFLGTRGRFGTKKDTKHLNHGPERIKIWSKQMQIYEAFCHAGGLRAKCSFVATQNRNRKSNFERCTLG